MNNPLLSICIPTYNREKYLKLLLESIVSQDGFCDEVEVLIYNDPCPDNTHVMVEDFLVKYPNIKYHRNTERIGMIPSILDSVTKCSGKYVWFFSDDDIMSDIAIKIMLETIKKEDPDLILNKFVGFNDSDSIDHKQVNHDGEITSVIGIENYFQFLSTVPYSIDGYMMHCSLFCFKKELFSENLASMLQKHGAGYFDILKKDYFAHVKIIYIPFGTRRKITIIEKNLVLLRAGNISRTFIFKTCTDYLHLIQELHQRYNIPSKTYLKMKALYYYSVFTYIVIVYIQKYIPKGLYNWLVNIGKRIVKVVKIG